MFRFNNPQEVRDSRYLSTSMTTSMLTSTDEPLDWSYAQRELLEKQGIDLKLEMEKK